MSLYVSVYVRAYVNARKYRSEDTNYVPTSYVFQHSSSVSRQNTASKRRHNGAGVVVAHANDRPQTANRLNKQRHLF